jgi:hypothetical protein
MNSPSDQVAHAAETSNALALGLAPAFSLAQQYAIAAHALGLQLLNQASAQQSAALSQNAVTTMVCTELLSLSAAAVLHAS